MSGRFPYGKVYEQVLEELDLRDPKVAFYTGVLVCVAEKTKLGACHGGMIRPQKDLWETVLFIAVQVADVYGLRSGRLKCDRGDEIWIHTHESSKQWKRLSEGDLSKRDYHLIRGQICGIPMHEINLEFDTVPEEEISRRFRYPSEVDDEFGLSREEMRIISKLSEVMNLFSELGDPHPSDAVEFSQGIHVLQRHVMARLARRRCSETSIDLKEN